MTIQLPGGDYEIFPEVWEIYENVEDKAYRTAWLIEKIQAEVTRQLVKKQREGCQRIYDVTRAHGWEEFAEKVKIAIDGVIALIDPDTGEGG